MQILCQDGDRTMCMVVEEKSVHVFFGNNPESTGRVIFSSELPLEPETLEAGLNAISHAWNDTRPSSIFAAFITTKPAQNGHRPVGA